ncbi:hypothetical protein D3C73_1060000 [compost metagenome]
MWAASTSPGVTASRAASSGSISPFFHSEIMPCTCRSRALSVVASSSWMMDMASSASRMENVGLSPALRASSRSIFTPNEWNVLMIRPLDSLRSTSVLTRSSISRAALLVKVMATTLRPI